MDVDYLNKKISEDLGEPASLTKESIIILAVCLTVVILLTICLFSFVCYDCIHTLDKESTGCWLHPNIALEEKRLKEKDDLPTTKLTMERWSWKGSRRCYSNKNADIQWI